jgi:hypothetical protein
MDKVYKVINYVKNVLNKPTNYKEFSITSRGVKMRNPIDRNGLWIGWTTEETANHLASIHLPPIEGGKNYCGKK